MIHPETHIVKQEDIRLAGPQDKCLYCGSKIGELHKIDCVMRNKTVVIRATIDYVIEVPEFWDKDNIEFHRNGSSWCASNFVSELEELDKNVGCLCSFVDFEYVREATEDDEENCGYKGEIND
jgi:hypothetical protein